MCGICGLIDLTGHLHRHLAGHLTGHHRHLAGHLARHLPRVAALHGSAKLGLLFLVEGWLWPMASPRSGGERCYGL